jgi:hypothetical protein
MFQYKSQHIVYAKSAMHDVVCASQVMTRTQNLTLKVRAYGVRNLEQPDKMEERSRATLSFQRVRSDLRIGPLLKKYIRCCYGVAGSWPRPLQDWYIKPTNEEMMHKSPSFSVPFPKRLFRTHTPSNPSPR